MEGFTISLMFLIFDNYLSFLYKLIKLSSSYFTLLINLDNVLENYCFCYLSELSILNSKYSISYYNNSIFYFTKTPID